MAYPSEENNYLSAHAHLLVDSYRRLLGKQLLAEPGDEHAFARRLFHAPFAVVSHDTSAEPIFNYANLTALRLFAMDWPEFTQLPSRLSAEPVNQAERERLLAQVTQQGYIDNYQGVRISKTGQRFLIKNAVVWNLLDEQGHYQGQAACFQDWQFL
ncbi:MAG: MEKHLA domain-containing protein [Methylococcales bacterium]